jgi:hypothetical protein
MAGEGLQAAGSLLQLGLTQEAADRATAAEAEKIGFENLLREVTLPLQAAEAAQKLNILRPEVVSGGVPIEAQSPEDLIESLFPQGIDQFRGKSDKEIEESVRERFKQIRGAVGASSVAPGRGPAGEERINEFALVAEETQGVEQQEEVLQLGKNILERAGVASGAEVKAIDSILQGEILKQREGLKGRIRGILQGAEQEQESGENQLDRLTRAVIERSRARSARATGVGAVKDDARKEAQDARKSMDKFIAANPNFFLVPAQRASIMGSFQSIVEQGTQDQVNAAFQKVKASVEGEGRDAGRVKRILEVMGFEGAQPPRAARERRKAPAPQTKAKPIPKGSISADRAFRIFGQAAFDKRAGKSNAQGFTRDWFEAQLKLLKTSGLSEREIQQLRKQFANSFTD